MYAPAKNLGIQISGVQELKSNVAALIETVSSDKNLAPSDRKAIIRKARGLLGLEMREAAEILADKIRQLATAQRWPKDAIDGIFRYFDPEKPRRSTALVGIAKRTSMEEWRAGVSKHPRAKARPGKIISMSLATMFEYGTGWPEGYRMGARPAVRPAIAAVRSQVLGRVAEGYRNVISNFDWTGGSISRPSPSKVSAPNFFH